MGAQRLQDERDKQNERLVIRAIEVRDDAAIARIIRRSLVAHGLDRPGTAYFDPELDHLSRYYSASPHRAYFIAELDGTVVGDAASRPRSPSRSKTLRAAPVLARSTWKPIMTLWQPSPCTVRWTTPKTIDRCREAPTPRWTCSLKRSYSGGRAKGALIQRSKGLATTNASATKRPRAASYSCSRSWKAPS